MAAWSHNSFLNEVKVQHCYGSTHFSNYDTRKSGAMGVELSKIRRGTHQSQSTSTPDPVYIFSPTKRSSATITGMSWETTDIGYTCRLEKLSQPSVGPLRVQMWKLFYEGSDHYFEATHGNQPLTMTFMLLDTISTPVCPVSDILKIEEGIFGKVAQFEHITRNPDAISYDAEDRISIDFDYAKRDPERQYRGDAEDSEILSLGRKHKLIISFPTVTKSAEHDSVAVHSIMPFKKMQKPALSHPHDGPGMRPRFDIVRMSSSSFSTITEDGYIHSLERVWYNHRSTTLWVPNPLLENAGLFVVLLTLTNGAQSFSKVAREEQDFPFAKARLEIVGAKDIPPSEEKSGFVW